jgi:hypothetical protein
MSNVLFNCRTLPLSHSLSFTCEYFLLLCLCLWWVMDTPPPPPTPSFFLFLFCVFQIWVEGKVQPNNLNVHMRVWCMPFYLIRQSTMGSNNPYSTCSGQVTS